MPAYLVAYGSALNRSMTRLEGMIIGFVSSSLFRTLLYDELKRHLDGAVSSALMILALGFLVLGSQSLEFHTVGHSAFVGQLIAVAGTSQLTTRQDAHNDYSNQRLTNTTSWAS